MQEKYTLSVSGQTYLLIWLSEKDKYYFSSEQLEKEKEKDTGKWLEKINIHFKIKS